MAKKETAKKVTSKLNISLELTDEMINTVVQAAMEYMQAERSNEVEILRKENSRLQAAINDLDRRQDEMLVEMRKLKSRQHNSEKKNLVLKEKAIE